MFAYVPIGLLRHGDLITTTPSHGPIWRDDIRRMQHGKPRRSQHLAGGADLGSGGTKRFNFELVNSRRGMCRAAPTVRMSDEDDTTVSEENRTNSESKDERSSSLSSLAEESQSPNEGIAKDSDEYSSPAVLGDGRDTEANIEDATSSSETEPSSFETASSFISTTLQDLFGPNSLIEMFNSSKVKRLKQKEEAKKAKQEEENQARGYESLSETPLSLDIKGTLLDGNVIRSFLQTTSTQEILSELINSKYQTALKSLSENSKLGEMLETVSKTTVETTSSLNNVFDSWMGDLLNNIDSFQNIIRRSVKRKSTSPVYLAWRKREEITAIEKIVEQIDPVSIINALSKVLEDQKILDGKEATQAQPQATAVDQSGQSSIMDTPPQDLGERMRWMFGQAFLGQQWIEKERQKQEALNKELEKKRDEEIKLRILEQMEKEDNARQKSYTDFVDELFDKVLETLGVGDIDVPMEPPIEKGVFVLDLLPAWAAYAFDVYNEPKGAFWQTLITGSKVAFTSPQFVTNNYKALLHAQLLNLDRLGIPLEDMRIFAQQGELLISEIKLDLKRHKTNAFFLYVERMDEPVQIQIFAKSADVSKDLYVAGALVDMGTIVANDDKEHRNRNVDHSKRIHVPVNLSPLLETQFLRGFSSSIPVLGGLFSLQSSSERRHQARKRPEIMMQAILYPLNMTNVESDDEYEEEGGDEEEPKFEEKSYHIDIQALRDVDSIQWDKLVAMLGTDKFVPRRNERVLFLDNDETDTQLCIWRDMKARVICVAFRGTEQDKWKDLATDSMTMLQPFIPGQGTIDLNMALSNNAETIKTQSCVHYGFLRAYSSVRDELRAIVHNLLLQSFRMNKDVGGTDDAKWTLAFTGHSLGASLATICASDFAVWYKDYANVDICTLNFGSPKCGNAHFAQIFNQLVRNAYRVVNDADVIARMPRSDYHHAGCTVLINEAGDVWVDDKTSSDPLLSRWSSFSDLMKAEMALMETMTNGKSVNDHMETAYFDGCVRFVTRKMTRNGKIYDV